MMKKYIKIRKIGRTVTKEVSKYKYASYMRDFPDGTPEKFKELTGKKVSQKDIKAFKKSQEPEKVEKNSDVDGSITDKKDEATK